MAEQIRTTKERQKLQVQKEELKHETKTKTRNHLN
jgi:hypothetical protein